MRIDRLGELLGQKYGLRTEGAVYPPRKPEIPVGGLPAVHFPTPSMAQVENFVRTHIDTLWNLPNKAFNILRACADSEPKNPKNAHEQLAVDGFKFCRHILSIVDYLKANRDSLSVSDIRKGLTELKNSIVSNMHLKDLSLDAKDPDHKQFPHVSATIFEMMPASKKYERKLRDQQYAKARQGLSRIVSLVLTVINQLNEWGGAGVETGRFEPEGAKLSDEEIEVFIRNNGNSYGIPDKETFYYIIDANPDLEKPLTRLVHALSRGKVPKGADRFKSIIQNILRKRQQLTQTNVSALEKEEPGPNPLTLFEEEDGEESEAWDAKIAFKYNDLALGNLLRKGNL